MKEFKYHKNNLINHDNCIWNKDIIYKSTRYKTLTSKKVLTQYQLIILNALRLGFPFFFSYI